MYKTITSNEDKLLLEKWFWCDYNCVPPMYILQPITIHLPDYQNSDEAIRKIAKVEWWKVFERMQIVLREAASKAIIDEDSREKYYISGK